MADNKYCSMKFKTGEELDRALNAALCSCEDATRAEAAANRAEQAADQLENITAAVVGAAPAGYGYDGANSTVLELFKFAGETAEEKLTSLFNSMVNNSAVQIVITDVAGLGGFQFYGTFYRLSTYAGGFATAVLYGYDERYERPICVRKSMIRGVWQPYEWENPPMGLGKEYRTTERYMGKPVYVKLVSFALAEGKGTTKYGLGVSNVKNAFLDLSKSRIGTEDGIETLLPLHPWITEIRCAKSNDSCEIRVVSASDYVVGHTAWVCVKYTKTTD